MVESGSEKGCRGRAHVEIIASIGLLLLCLGACGGSLRGDEEPRPAVLPSGFPLSIGMTWDECVPVLNTKKRLTEPDRPTPNRVVATYKIGDGAYKLTFERPAPPDVGPYRLVRIESSSTPAPGPSNAEITQGLRSGMTLDEALPLMRRIGGVAGGYFAMQTKDRFTAVLQTDDGNNIRVTFQRPKEVQRPDVIKDTPQDIVDKMGHIPLDALPEFGAYRVTSVETSKGR